MKNLLFLTLFLSCCLHVKSQGEDIYLPRANECFEKGDYECAKRYYMLFQASSKMDMSGQVQKSDDCLKHLTAADNFFMKKEYEKARDRCRLVLERNPKDMYAQKLYGMSSNRLRHAVLPSDYNTEMIPPGNPANPVNTEIDMIYVKGGTYIMGCTTEQGTGCFDGEKPAHRVTVGDFYIGKYEVTQALWKSIMGTNPSHFKGDYLPVEWVSWNDVQVFIRKLNAQTGKQYRLPTEAEWEFAARGGNMSKGYKYSGSNTADDAAWYHENAGDKPLDDNTWNSVALVSNNNRTHPVGTKLPNELGIYDMSGNVWEWCNDCYEPYSDHAQNDPQGPSSGAYHLFRGGAWHDYAHQSRVSTRYYVIPDFRLYALGFRLASGSE